MSQDLISQCPIVESLLRTAAIIACSDAPVLISGETGTGKELLADYVQSRSPRADKPFIKLNCAALPQKSLESALFGHKKGVFETAVQDHIGLLEMADGGSLFLDELATLPAHAQALLLRFVETGEIQPVGGTPKSLDVRIIAATSSDLLAVVEQGHFRQDLYYRLAVVPMALPTLRERRGDIKFLLADYAQQFRHSTYICAVSFDKKALRALLDYSWPGNIRELRNIVQGLSLLKPGACLAYDDLPEVIRQIAAPNKGLALAKHGLNLLEWEQGLIAQALRQARGNKSLAARLLGLSRDALNYRLKKHQLV